MSALPPRVALVTGASSGIGLACAAELIARGWRVHGGSRTVGSAPGVVAHRLDVTDAGSVASCFEAVVTADGRLDAVVHCAGVAWAGAVEDTTEAEARAQLDTNYFGAVAVARQAVARFRAQGHGTLVNVGSIAGAVPMAFQAHYSASKAALTAFTRALRLEVRRFGVHAVMVEPGDFSTQITAHRRLAGASSEGPYAATLARTLEVIRRDELGAGPPAAVARLVARVLETRRPAASYLVGPWHQRAAVTLRALLPAAWFDAVLARLYRL